MHSRSIGIDLGSHWTKVGIIEESSGRFHLINKPLRSIFAFNQNKNEVPIFGQEALDADFSFDDIIADANRDQKFAAKHGQDTSSAVALNNTVPFRCYADYDGGSYNLTLNNTNQTFAANQQAIIASILAHLKAKVVKELGDCQECHAIIAVPSFASDNHRRVILEAAQLAGCFTSVQLLNQTTAALIAYNFDQQKMQRNWQKQANEQQLFGLIYFGANSFECSLFHPFDVNDAFAPKLVATAGTTELGSSSFTERLAWWCLLIKIEEEDSRLAMNLRSQIWEKCDEAKQRLSRSTSTKIHLHYPTENGLKNVEINLKRADFERLCQSPLAKLGQIIEPIFGPYRGRIGRLVLAGEGWRMPKFMQMVEPYLAKNCVKMEGNYMTTARDLVVKGAAIKARAMEKRRQKENKPASTGGGQENAPFEDLLYRQVDLTLADVSQNLFQANLQIPTGESTHFTLKGEIGKFLLEEDGIQMARLIVRNDNFDDFNQIAFRIGLNGLLRARLYNFRDQQKELEFVDNENWSNLHGNDGLKWLREELTKLSILPCVNANSDELVEIEEVKAKDKSAPNLYKNILERALNLFDNKMGHGNVVDVKQTEMISISNRSFADATAGSSQQIEEVKKNEENFPALPQATSSAETPMELDSGEKEMKVPSPIAIHCKEVMEDVGKLSSSKLNFYLGHWKLGDIYANLGKCESWPLYMDFLAEAETVRAKHWAYLNSQKMLQIVRSNQWGPEWAPPFDQAFMSYRLERDFLSKLGNCADHDLVNFLYMEFVDEIRKELKHDDFKEANELKHLLEDKYVCHYQPIGHE